MTESVDELLERVGREAEEAELMSADPEPLPESVKVTRGHGRSRTLQVRLNEDEYEQLELIAKASHLPVSTVARSVLLAAVAPTSDPNAAILRIETDLAALKRLMSKG